MRTLIVIALLLTCASAIGQKAELDPFSTDFFRINDTKTQLKLSQVQAGLYIYTKDGIKNNSDGLLLIVATTSVKKALTTAEDVANSMLEGQHLEQEGFTDRRVKNKTTIKVGGYEAFEEEIYYTQRGKDNLIYLFVIMHPQKAIVFQGVAKSDYETSLQGFKQLTKTIEFK